MPRTVCIDAMICVWGIKRKATPGQEYMIEMAQALFENLKKEEAILILPSPVVTEILSPVPHGERADLISKLSKVFRIIPVDTMVAIKASELWHNNTTNWKSIYKKKGDEGIRNRFKFDLLIAATAITRNVDYFYTEDNPLIELCKSYINVGHIPVLGMSPQLSMFKKPGT